MALNVKIGIKYAVFFGLAGALVGMFLGFYGARILGERSSVVTAGALGGQSPNGSDETGETAADVVKLTDEQIHDFAIEVAKAGPATLAVERLLYGEIVMDPDRVAYIVPRVGGVAASINETVGDMVGAGQVVAVIESRDLADAKASYLGALERLVVAKANFERENKLWQDKLSPEADYLKARQNFSEATIALRNAKQDLYTLGFDEEYLKKLPDLPDTSFTRYEVEAPFAGTVIERNVGLGEVVTDSSQIFRIADLSHVWAELRVYQKDCSVIAAGQKVVIRSDGADVETAGVIDYVSGVIETATRTAVVRVAIDNADRTWRPGTFVTGLVEAGRINASVVVARSGLQKLNGKDIVFVQTGEGFQPRAVEIGKGDSDSVEIVGGLTAGETYVRSHAFTLKAQMSKSTFAGDDDD